MEVKIRGIEDLISAFKDMPQAVPYALATALTRLTREAQTTIIEHTRATFKIRTGWLARTGRYGILVSPATKNTLSSNVRSEAPWMLDHATGETRYAATYIASRRKKGLQGISTPSFFIRLYRRAGREINLINPKTYKAFTLKTPTSDLYFGRLYKKGKLILTAITKPHVRIVKRWFFIESGLHTIKEKEKEVLDGAIATITERFKQ